MHVKTWNQFWTFLVGNSGHPEADAINLGIGSINRVKINNL